MKILTKEMTTCLYNRSHDDKFAFLCNRLEHSIGCTYVTYLIEKENRKYFFSSKEDWQQELFNNKLINKCPIYKYAFEALSLTGENNIFTIWDYVPHKKGEEQDLLCFRSSFNIAHGIGIAIAHKDMRESIVFAGHRDDKNFHNKVLNSNHINECLDIFRSSTLFI